MRFTGKSHVQYNWTECLRKNFFSFPLSRFLPMFLCYIWCLKRNQCLYLDSIDCWCHFYLFLLICGNLSFGTRCFVCPQLKSYARARIFFFPFLLMKSCYKQGDFWGYQRYLVRIQSEEFNWPAKNFDIAEFELLLNVNLEYLCTTDIMMRSIRNFNSYRFNLRLQQGFQKRLSLFVFIFLCYTLLVNV